MIAAVLDTNILASGTVTAATPPGQILDRRLDRQFELVVSEHIIDELERTLSKPYFQKHLTSNAIRAFIDLLQSKATMIPITIKVKGIATHPEDDLVIADGEVVSTFRIRKVDEGIKIERMATRKEYRGKDISKGLMEYVLKEIKKNKPKKIWMEAQMQAQQFYEKCGFKAVSKPYDLYGISHLKMGYTE